MKNRKVVLIGCGAVGCSFLYAALNQSLFDEYVLIDAFENLSSGNALDFEDANVFTPTPAKYIKHGDYSDCTDADVIVITAGVPQKPGGETRLELIGRNAKIIKEIAENVKSSGFSGITVIASNPVDIIGSIYARITGFEENKVIPSGTILDSARLKFEIAKRVDVNPNSIQAYVVGEHGDSSVSAFSQVMVGSLPLSKYKKLTDSQKSAIHKDVMRKAYKIINAKRATYYGIGVCLARICKAILNDENLVLPVGIKKDPSSEVYIGWPTLVGKEGTHSPLKIELSAEEKKNFIKSYNSLKAIYKQAIEELENSNK
ncbi:MAG: L-lactate dehydrogenase [Malacoplasma sp.]|nr:L-lactate dehydrogenase [Malacoplasma sp.]